MELEEEKREEGSRPSKKLKINPMETNQNITKRDGRIHTLEDRFAVIEQEEFLKLILQALQEGGYT